MNFWNLLGLPSKQDYAVLQETLKGQFQQSCKSEKQLEELIHSLNSHQLELFAQNYKELSSQLENHDITQAETLQKGLSQQKQDMQALCTESEQAMFNELHTMQTQQQQYHSRTIDLLNSIEERQKCDSSSMLKHLTEQDKRMEVHQAEQLKILDAVKVLLEEMQNQQKENSTLVIRCFTEQEKFIHKRDEDLRSSQGNLQKTQIEILSEIDSLFKILKSIWMNELSAYLENLTGI